MCVFEVGSLRCPTAFSRAGVGSQGYAFVEFVERAEAEQAQLYLDGGQVSYQTSKQVEQSKHRESVHAVADCRWFVLSTFHYYDCSSLSRSATAWPSMNAKPFSADRTYTAAQQYLRLCRYVIRSSV